MSTLTIRLPDDTAQRLKQLAASRGGGLNKPKAPTTVFALGDRVATGWHGTTPPR